MKQEDECGANVRSNNWLGGSFTGKVQRLLALEVSCVLRSSEEAWWELHHARNSALLAISEHVERLERIERAAMAVVRWDWSSNDADCTADIDALAKALALTPNAALSSGGATEHPQSDGLSPPSA